LPPELGCGAQKIRDFIDAFASRQGYGRSRCAPPVHFDVSGRTLLDATRQGGSVAGPIVADGGVVAYDTTGAVGA
jgi:hypothetical protein